MLPGFDRSIARSRVANLLVTSTAGAASPPAHTTWRNSAPYFASRLISAVPELVFHVLPAGRNQSAALNVGRGTQACMAPSGLASSSRVTVWKLRQAPGVGANARSATAAVGSAEAATRAPPVLRTSRLFILIESSLWMRLGLGFGCADCI